MLENQLERIAVALEKLCALVAEMPKGETKAPAKEKKEPAKKENQAEPPKNTEPVKPVEPITTPEPPKNTEAAPITVEQLRAAVIEVQQKKGPAIAKKIVQEVGNAPQVTKIEVSKYQMVMDACKAALNGQ